MRTTLSCPPLGARAVVGIDLTVHVSDAAYSYATPAPGYVLFIRSAGRWRWTWFSHREDGFIYRNGSDFASLSGAVTQAREMFAVTVHTDETRACAHWRALDRVHYTDPHSVLHHDQRCEAHR